MQINLKTIKRILTCPILETNNWDYIIKNQNSEFTSFCIKEIMSWYSRRKRQIPYDILCPLIAHFGISKGFSPLEISNIQLGFKYFITHGLYSKIDVPLVNVNAQVGVGVNTIVYDIPVLTTIKNKVCIIFSNNRIITRENLMLAYETRFCSIWSFYILNKYPTFYNLFIENDKVKQVKFTPDQFYIRDNKKYFRNMSSTFSKKIYPASLDVCLHCSRREECQKMMIKKRK